MNVAFEIPRAILDGAPQSQGGNRAEPERPQLVLNRPSCRVAMLVQRTEKLKDLGDLRVPNGFSHLGSWVCASGHACPSDCRVRRSPHPQIVLRFFEARSTPCGEVITPTARLPRKDQRCQFAKMAAVLLW